MQKTLTSFDVATLVIELKGCLIGSRIKNIYQIDGRTVVLKLHLPSQPALSLLMESGKRLHLTSYALAKPKRPPAFCMALRKHIRNGTITEINQYEFERIVIIKVRARQEEFRIVLELFGHGNIILIDSQNFIKQAISFKTMRDRSILRGKLFQQAPPSGKNPMSLKFSDLKELKSLKGFEVIKALSKFLSISGIYAEEILFRAQVDKSKKCELLGKGDLKQIFEALDTMCSYIRTGRFEPCAIIDKNGEWIDVVPVTLKKYSELICEKFKSFNEALDEYYIKTLTKQVETTAAKKVEQQIAKQQRILTEQQTSLEKALRQAKLSREIGDKIYANFHQLQSLLQRIVNEKESGNSWKEACSKIEEEKKNGITPSNYFESLDTKKLILNVSIEDIPFSLKLRSTVQENATKYYNRAKKTEKKAKGAEKAIAETMQRIEDLKRKKAIAVEETSKPFLKKRKKAWYEKFRWFYTSEDLLVVGGKDAGTNEILIKKHAEPGDLVFHADIIGAPFVLIKAEGKTPSDASLHEAAQLAASHSRAWRMKFGAIDVYWVYPEQLSKTPPSKEYLPKGAFSVHGKKNFIKKTLVRLAVGINVKKKPFAIIVGPKEAVRTRTNIYVEIIPGDLPSSKLANRIRQMLKQKAAKNLQEKISKIPLEEIQALIPFGKGRLSNH
ncbi:MAG: NFACT family protein [Candidatus Bathyarchaeota archaeon]|nr:MAG: NFACT family protein [Candidatus Bathyarchaeota archaeon]